MSPPFDHNRLHSLLEEADRFLRCDGRHAHAWAVSTALSILIDEVGRMAEGRRVANKLREIGEHPPSRLATGEEGVRDAVRQLAYTMEQYVTQPEGPWIGTPLFAKDWPDGELTQPKEVGKVPKTAWNKTDDAPDYDRYPCCGHEHRWLPGPGKWFCTRTECRCVANSLDELEERRYPGQMRHPDLLRR